MQNALVTVLIHYHDVIKAGGKVRYIYSPTGRQNSRAQKILLFIRSREGVSITPAGLMVVSYALDSTRVRNEIIDTARAVHRGEIPVLRIGFSSFVSPDTLQSFRDLYANVFPECPMRLWGGDPVQILHRMEQRTLDGALLPMPIHGEDWVVEHVASDQLVICMRIDDPLAAQTRIEPTELARKLTIFRDPETHPERLASIH